MGRLLDGRHSRAENPFRFGFQVDPLNTLPAVVTTDVWGRGSD